MLPSLLRSDRRRDRALFMLVGSSFALALACSDAAAPSIHGAGAGVVGPANDIQVAPASAALSQGGRALLRCAAFDSRGVMLSNPPVWTSSDPSVVSVNSDGAVTAQHAGGATVSCQIGSRTAIAPVTVSTAHIAFVEVTPGAGILTNGGSIQLAGIPRDSFGLVVPGSDVQWSSGDTNIATVSAGGVVTAKATGDADIRAVSGGVVGMNRIKVSPTPPPPVASITVSVDQSSLSVGQLAHATATTMDASGQVVTGRAITWSVSNPSVISAMTTNATKANVRALGQGTSVLTATSEGKSASVNMTVGAPTVASVSTSLASSSIIVGQTTLASAVPLDGLGNPMTASVSWSSLDPSIATVSSSGVVTGVAAGSVIIRASAGGVTGDASLTVTTAPVASVTTTLAVSSLTVGQTTQATAVSKDASGNTLTGRYVSWSSLSPSVATVSISGMVTAVAAGSAVIRATVESKTGDATLTVNAPALTQPAPGPTSSVTVTIDSTSLATGHTSQAHVVAKDANGIVLTGKTPTWASQATSIATVTQAAVVSGVAVGNTKIQATIDGIVGTANLSVISTSTSPGPTASVTVSIDSVSIAAGHTAQARAVAKDASGVTLTGKTASWISKNTSIATVNSSTGVVTGVSAGTATIQGTIDGINGTSSLTVNVPQIITAPPAAGSNQPSDNTLIRWWSGDTLTTSQFYPSHPTNPSIVVDPTSPDGSTNTGQILFPAGFSSGSAPGGLWQTSIFSQKLKQVYVSFWVKLSSNWVGNAAGANKIGYMNVDGQGRGSFEFLAMGGLDGTEQTLAPMIVLEGVNVAPGAADANSGSPSVALTANMQPYSTSIAYQRGTWGHYEILMTLNSAPGVTDGSIKWWWNGALYGDYTNRIDWGITSTSGFTQVYWEPTYGGAGPAVPADQYMWLKSFKVAGK